MTESICKSFAPSGKEENLRKLIEKQLEGIFDDIYTDNLGNLICKSGRGGLCIECGLDGCGIMIVSKESQKAYFAGVGGISAEYLIGKKILFDDGNFGIVRYEGKAPADAKMSDLYLETDTENLRTGDFGVVKSGYCETSDKMFANGLGNKIGAAVLIKALKDAKKPENLCVVFSAQKRLGGRGLQAFFGAMEFENVITVDSIDCGSVIKSGNGSALMVVDKTGVCNSEFKEKIEELIASENIDAFTAVTDENLFLGNISTLGKGCKCVGVAVPVENKNKNFEAVKKSDFEAAVKLLTTIIDKL